MVPARNLACSDVQLNRSTIQWFQEGYHGTEY